MLIAIDELSKILKLKWDINISENEMILFDFYYSWSIPVATTELKSINREAGIVRLKFRTSFGIFHQSKLQYNDILVVLCENVSGALADLYHDLVISELTYPPKLSRTSVSCSNNILTDK